MEEELGQQQLQQQLFRRTAEAHAVEKWSCEF
jgi:hypothetical protein